MSDLRRAAALAAVCALGALGLLTSACNPSSPPVGTVVLYTSVDQPFAADIIERFEKTTGIRVQVAYDSEAGKTTGFIRRLVREKQRPVCDVWWSSEVFGTIELAREDVLAAYASPAAADIPAAWRDAEHRWTGLAARARVLAFDNRRVAADALPATWGELAGSPLFSKMAIANPQFGTTRGHVAALFAYWGRETATAFVQQLREARATVADGNSHAVRLVLAGQADSCWTDTDDVWVGRQRSGTLDLVYPRIAADGPVIWIPCSVALIAGGPNAAAGRKLVDFLVGVEVERALARSDSRNVPVRPELARELELDDPPAEALDFERVADALPEAMKVAREILLQ